GKVINAKEADLIANRIYELAIAQYRKKPEERLSVGVVTMNIHQQEFIYDLVENLRRNDSQFDRALAVLESETTEPFFIKNLENIQGDERDVMIISCTYGPQTPGGTPTQRFGPLNREGGERRFNVLITRAKCRMEIFSSIKSQQIITEGKCRGVQDFHFLLKYCETGRLDEAGEKTDRGHDSPFEEQVEAVLRSAGFIVEHQIGVAGYFIDLAVRHPRDNGRFAIGVECDGKTYHSSRAARDRDRLREQVLAERGWTLHRIWSTDWFVNHQQARSNLLRVVASACD
ncbi:MAG TPA: AAA domain-containing protein, partial [Candidatus Saccharimonadales bacterium]|nr:AAA domain-containing protein [Candidatus Saccharimonadales bacterium]